MNRLLLRYLLPLRAPDGGSAASDGGAADGGVSGGGGGEGGAPAADTEPTTALGGEPKPATGDKDTGDTVRPDGADKDSTPKGEGEDGDDGKPKADDTDGKPDELTLTAPEGFETFQPEFDAFAKDMGGWLKDNPDATPRDALAEAARRQAEAAQKAGASQQEAFDQQLTKWEDEAKADPEIGGADFDANVAIGVRAIEAFGTPALKQVLNESGLGNHPEFIRFAVKAGKQVSEAGAIAPSPARGAKTLQDALYGAD